MSLDMSVNIYEMTRNLPEDEKYGLTSQIKRAADSVSLNIAEGSTGQTNAQFSNFLGYAIRSGIEVVGCLYLLRAKKIIGEEAFRDLYEKMEDLIKRIQSLRKTLNVKER